MPYGTFPARNCSVKALALFSTEQTYQSLNGALPSRTYSIKAPFAVNGKPPIYFHFCLDGDLHKSEVNDWTL